MRNLIAPFLIITSIALSACNSVPNYREPSNVNTTPKANITLEPTKEMTDPILPAENYSEYENETKLKTINLTEGPDGPSTIAGDLISVHYSGFLTDGTLFDSSRMRGEPFQFPLGQGMVIEGWDEGFLDKKIGDKFTLVIPPTKGYGARDLGDIPPNSVLIFEVEIMGIEKS